MIDESMEFLDLLPQKYPMKLVDAVLELRSDYVKAVKNVTINEPFFPGHFPGMPLMPGVLIIEALAQASSILAMKIGGKGNGLALGLLTGIDKAHFRQMVVPGDRLILESRCVRNRQQHYRFETTASVDGKLVVTAQLKSFVQVKG